MRLLLWVLLVTLVALLSSADALSAANPDKKQASQRNADKAVTPRALAVDFEFNNLKRSLRGESEKTETDKVDEERHVSDNFRESLERFVAKLREKNPFSTANIEKRYTKLAKGGTTPDFYYRGYQSATWQTRSWKKKVYKKYLAWYTTKYDPNWVSSLAK